MAVGSLAGVVIGGQIGAISYFRSACLDSDVGLQSQTSTYRARNICETCFRLERS